MHRICVLCLCFIFYSFIPYCFSQENIDNIWMFGYPKNSTLPLFQGSIIDFGGEIPEALPQAVNLSMDFANASICDEEGNLLFYTNGRLISNAEHELMENGDNLNLDFMLGANSYLITVQGTMILPVPNDPTRYYVFHLGLRPIYPDGILNISSGPFFYSILDFNNPSFPLGELVSSKYKSHEAIFYQSIYSLFLFEYGKCSMRPRRHKFPIYY